MFLGITDKLTVIFTLTEYIILPKFKSFAHKGKV